MGDCTALSDVLRLARAVRRRARRAVAAAPQQLSGVRSTTRGDGVALTFDDGPDPVFTPAVLDALAAAGAHATFFLVGAHAARAPALVRRIVAEGRGLGSHSQTHRDPWTLSPRELVADYRGGRRAVETASGLTVRAFRPPKGHLDGAGAAAIRLAGVRPWLWSVDPEDWAPGATASQLRERVAHAAAGDVVLLHDGLAGPGSEAAADRSATVSALPGILAGLRGRRLEPVLLS